MTTNEKIALLRGEMYKNNLKGYIVPTGDPHISEYVADFYRFRHWISGFTGSAGTFALTDKKSGLWTDGRYYIQAEIELSGSECELYKAYEPGVISYVQFFCNELSEGDRVGVDAKLMSNSAVKNIQREFNKKGIELVVDCDLSYIWEDRPSLPYTKLLYWMKSTQAKAPKARRQGFVKNSQRQGQQPLLQIHLIILCGFITCVQTTYIAVPLRFPMLW